MNGGDLFGDFLEGLLLNAPVFLALAVGAIISLTYWERNPQVALFGTLGFTWLALSITASIAWNRVLVPDVFPDAGSLEEKLSYVAFSGLEAVGYVLLMLAAFMFRRQPRHAHYLDDPHDVQHRDRY